MAASEGLARATVVVEAASVAAACTKWATSHGTGDRSTFCAVSGRAGVLVHRAGTWGILTLFPLFAVYAWYINEHCDGSLLGFLGRLEAGGWAFLVEAYPSPSWAAVRYILGFGLLQGVLQVWLPGPVHRGPTTPRGNVPTYTANGVPTLATTLLIFLATWRAGLFDPGAVYDCMGSIVSTSNIMSLILCTLLYLKANDFSFGWLAPSSTDSGTTGSLLYDFYWGMELYPRIGAFDIKVWTNCRMGMMGWSVITLCYAVKQAQLYGAPATSMLLSVALVQVYIFKFFLWETGYWSSMDIAHDRAGFYLCWGCLVWIPAVYTSPAMYLVRRPVNLPLSLTLVLGFLGLAAIYINYDSDRQRQEFRQSDGKALVWGAPPQAIRAQYRTGDGRTKTSLLLVSGWWGLARHFHYLPELVAAAIWSMPAFHFAIMPFVYLAFLTILLLDRAYRDDARCSAKYGKYWDQYCQRVPYRVVPYLF
ncbi:7-dehydrocholesterol reductase [Auxenochlorella protothecoides]|uniref:7-dehydrocholesterol reductase n=1 Tax=Auxenochlorella protothecoides TaxID=3075 RepID=A0A087SNR8_AUXPR|nr:7-dehydrocholesterol reductase [Auxenochlorella protothecoides]KFM27372.1 7-dehydrocholesterol reductase [Auxenochlorella protothecoides]RMZ56067.1 hypothetical protein APUTEX25_004491 [Auxenochlorella protothecoides]|eukprot:RMZ56067.1 hypothetical protein APUTEX25_004491 [Auxenochlorella protothecoides]